MTEALRPALATVELSTPAGPTWEFLILFLVVIVGPPLMTRARAPGIVGLLIGGFVIGPYGLDLIGSGNTTVPDLGQFGLLYLMFVAGVELDLALVRIHRRDVLVFGFVSFALPMAIGTGIGLALGWVPAAALLLGVLVSSPTLLLYPTVRGAGLAADGAVATAVGATVITDTAALVVLAAVSGTQIAGGTPGSVALQIALGLFVLVAFSLVVLPRAARLAFRYLGTDRVVRYLLAVASFLSAGTVAYVFGIEPIVGAFFAGLALNRLVPNEGPLMDRIDFFGSAVFIPVFLVSVGLLLEPKVLIEGETLKLAGLFTLAAIGGKALSTLVARFALGYTSGQATLMLGLTATQAAATLAATVIGFNVGLFDQSVVNAALLLILASIVVGTVLVDRAVPAVPTPEGLGARIGSRILVVLTDPDQAVLAFAIAARVAAPEGGMVRGLLASPRGEAGDLGSRLRELEVAGFASNVDTEPRLLVHHALADGVVDVATEARASLVIIGAEGAPDTSPFGSDAEAIAAGLAVPVAVLLGDGPSVREVEVVREADDRPGGTFDADGLAIDIARRIAGTAVEASDLVPESLEPPRPGLLRIMPTTSWQLLAGTVEPRSRSAILLLPDV